MCPNINGLYGNIYERVTGKKKSRRDTMRQVSFQHRLVLA